MVRGGSASVRHRLEHWAVSLVAVVLGVLPEPVSGALGWGLGWVAGSLLRIRRSAVDANLARAFPHRSRGWRRRVAARVFPHIGREAVTLLRLSRMSSEELRNRTSVEGLEELRSALDEGRGLLVLTGHLGNWEVGGGAVAVRGIPLDVVAQRQKNPLVNRRLEAARRALGMSVIYRKEAARRILRSLRDGRAVAMVADQNVRSGGVFVDFFRTPASTSRAPALLAMRAEAPVFLGTALRLPGHRARYRVRLRRLAVPPPGDGDEAVRTFTRRYMAALEGAIREAPDQYFWPHYRWKTRPQGAGRREEPDGAAPV